MRVTRSLTRKNRKAKILKEAKGFFGRKNRCADMAKTYVENKWLYQYRDRRRIKRNMRSLWIMRINAAARLLGFSYSNLMHAFSLNKIELNRKSLSEIAISNFEAFEKLVRSVIN